MKAMSTRQRNEKQTREERAMATRSIINNARTVGRVIITAAAIVGNASLMVRADVGAGTDPMRCEALKLRCDSRYHMCLSRCDKVADRRALRAPEDGERVRSQCSNACDLRHYRKLLRLEERPVCRGRDPKPQPASNPQACAAELLWIKANYMQCKGRCHVRFDQRPAFDCDDCVSRCYDEYRADTESTNTEPICGDGPAEAVPDEAEPAECASN